MHMADSAKNWRRPYGQAFATQSAGVANAAPSSPEAELLRAAVRSFAYKAYAVKALELLAAEKNTKKSTDANAPEA